MKKIIVITFSLFALLSCGIETDNEIIENKIVENIEKEISFSSLENNLNKLKSFELNSWELGFINSELLSIFNRKIEEKAFNTNDLSVCEQLDENVDNCKYNVTIKFNDIEKCNLLSADFFIIDCKNQITKNIAYDNLDETVCDDLLDDSEEKYIINSCINRVITLKASKGLDLNLCEQISNVNEQDFCREAVEMEKIENEVIID